MPFGKDGLLLVATLPDNCLVSVPQSAIDTSTVCRTDRTLFERTPIEWFTEADLNTPLCPNLQAELSH
jgi:hypothetical protein